MPAPDQYAVVGHPIAHSQSPRIHRLFAQQCQQYMTYTAIDVTPEQLVSWVSKFFATAGRGLNVTVPYKQSLLTVPRRLSERARTAGALNTLLQDAEGHLIGDNTDGIGLIRDLTENLQVTITAHRVLLLGAGGAARGVIAPLLELKPAQLVIANRALERGQALADAFCGFGPIRATTYADLEGAKFDLIVNATAASLHGEVPPLPADVLAGKNTSCYDMSYGDEDTPFVRWAREHGATRACMGLGMLIEQAAESFYLWRGLRPNTHSVRAALGVRDEP
jgi:shikimate dehydrogenase